jgi:hypothetical protein
VCFEPHPEIIPKGKASTPYEFGKLVKIQEAENQATRGIEGLYGEHGGGEVRAF